MADNNLTQLAGLEAIKSTPPVIVTGAAISGMSLSDWVTVLTGVYVLLQISVLLYRFVRERRADEAADTSTEEVDQ